MDLYAGRTMPTGKDDDRSVLTGVRIMLQAARNMESNAASNLKHLKTKHGKSDPRSIMQETLVRQQREAKDAAILLDGHEHTLSEHCTKLQHEYGRLAEMKQALAGAAAMQGLSASPSTSSKSAGLVGGSPRSPGSRPASAGPRSPGGKGIATSPLGSPGKAAVHGFGHKPWSAEEDAALLAQVTQLGFAWAAVSAGVAPRTGSQCKDRWEQMVEEAGRRARERQHAMSKAR